MDVSQYLEIFIDESAEHLQTLSDCIMELEKEPDNKDVINEIFRAAHSLKGMAGTMGFKRMQHLTHDMENVFQEVRSEKIQVDSQMIDLLFKCLDAIDGYLENIKATSDEGEEDNEVIIKELNDFINSYIYYNINVLYELRFCVKDNKQYALFRSMNVYDSDRYDGYFYRNGCLIVLYGADKAKNVLDNTWIKKGKYGIPNTRNIHMNEKLWTFPYPKAFEILPNGHLRELSHEEAFINVL